MNKEIKFMLTGLVAGIGLGLAVSISIGMVGEISKLDENAIAVNNEVKELSVPETIHSLRERLDIHVTNEFISNGKYKDSSGLVDTLELHRIANSLDDLNKNIKTLIENNEEKGE